MPPVAKRIAILTLWRNNGQGGQKTLDNYEWLENELIPQKYRFIYAFLENDSQDSTPFVLRSWLDTRKGFLISEHNDIKQWGSIQSAERTAWLGRYRNMCLNMLDYWDFDYLLVCDTDVSFRPDLIQKMVDGLDENSSWGMITPNTVQYVTDAVGGTGLPSYYDSWALVDADGCQALTFASNPFLSPYDRESWDRDEHILVSSAFGSIAMIKAEALGEDVKWDGRKGCEHWGLCKSIRDEGYDIIVDPLLHAEIQHKEEVIPAKEVIEYQHNRLRLAQSYTFANQDYNYEPPISFGICTGYDNLEHLKTCIKSIRDQAIPEYEIILIGPDCSDDIRLELGTHDIRFLTFDESTRPLWITKKKNVLAHQAIHDRLCLMHDYLRLDDNWYESLRFFEMEYAWSVLAFPQQRLDGGRFWYDWSGFRGPRALDQREFYQHSDWNHQADVYISGNIFCVHKELLKEFPFNESLGHMQEEDLEWSQRLAPFVHFKCAYSCHVYHQKEHRDHAFFLKVDVSVTNDLE
jgi:GT2 family glycosyltransferase